MKGDLGLDVHRLTGTATCCSSATEEGLWVDYHFLNLATGDEASPSTAWVVRHDGVLIGSGWYE